MAKAAKFRHSNPIYPPGPKGHVLDHVICQSWTNPRYNISTRNNANPGAPVDLDALKPLAIVYSSVDSDDESGSDDISQFVTKLRKSGNVIDCNGSLVMYTEIRISKGLVLYVRKYCG